MIIIDWIKEYYGTVILLAIIASPFIYKFIKRQIEKSRAKKIYDETSYYQPSINQHYSLGNTFVEQKRQTEQKLRQIDTVGKTLQQEGEEARKWYENKMFEVNGRLSGINIEYDTYCDHLSKLNQIIESEKQMKARLGGTNEKGKK